MKIEVYRNLSKDCFSVRYRGKVTQHTNTIVLANAHFVVQPAGRERVLKEKRKNVHAFVRGYTVPFNDEQIEIWLRSPEFLVREVTYNPYAADHFLYVDSNSRHGATFSHLAILKDKKVFAIQKS